MPVKHAHQSAQADNSDPNVVQPSHWNEDHVLVGLLALLDALAPTPNTVFSLSASGDPQLAPLSSFVRSLLSSADAAALRAAIAAAGTVSPAFTGTPTAPTPAPGDNSTKIATTAYTRAEIAALVAASPSALDTLNELAAALGNDANFAATVTAALAAKAPLASPTFTGTPAAPTPTTGDRTTKLATMAAIGAELGANVGLGGNLIINPSGAIWQTQNTGTAALTDGVYGWDQWYALTESNGITGSSLSDVENTTPNMMRLTQANVSAQRMGLAQPLAAADVKHLRGQAVTLSARVRASAALTLRYAILEWTGTADAPTKDVVNNWSSGTYTGGNFFISASTNVLAVGSVALSSNTLTDIAALTATVGNNMNNLIVFFWTEGTAAQNVTLDIGKVQLNFGSVAQRFLPRSFGAELDLCGRFYEKTYDLGTAPGAVTVSGQYRTRAAGASNVLATPITFVHPKLKSPTVTIFNPNSGASGSVRDFSNGADIAISGLVGTNYRGFASLATGAAFADASLHDFHWTADARM